jgi:hypothetical protein
LTRLRTRIAAVALAAVLPAAIAACGGGSSSNNADPEQILHETFSNPKSISSGNLDVSLGITTQGSQSGNFTAQINGPFQSGGSQGLPQFNLTGKLSGSAPGVPSISFEGGLVFTADNAYISYQGTAYRLPPQWFAKLKSLAGRTAQSPGSQQGISSLFSSLGIKPATWFKNLSDDGTATVGGTETDHISGDVDVAKVAVDLRKLNQLSQQIPGQNAKLKPAQLAGLERGVRNAHVDIYSGTDDHLLRRLSVSLDLAPRGGSGGSAITSLSIDFSVTLNDLNAPQNISAPKNAKPVPKSFLRQVLALGALGSSSLGGGGTLGGGSAGSSGGGGSGGALEQRYRRCVQSSGSSAQAINKCIQQLYG